MVTRYLLQPAAAQWHHAGYPGVDSPPGEIGRTTPRHDGVPAGRLAGHTILIVEDEALLAMDILIAFEDEGAEIVGPAASIDEAIGLVNRAVGDGRDIHGAILDVDVAGLAVYPVAARLRDRGIPFVFHTGHGSRIELAEMFPQALTCNKPVSTETLLATLLKLID